MLFSALRLIRGYGVETVVFARHLEDVPKLAGLLIKFSLLIHYIAVTVSELTELLLNSYWAIFPLPLK